MTRDEFEAAGVALYGENWIGPLSDASGISRRSIARMASGKADIPDDLAEPVWRATLLIADLRAVIAEHAPVADFVMNAELDHVSQRTRALLERSLNRIFGQ